ncbi:MAG: class I tRNA ligase family protein, partial [Vulcanimicrobiaceae bacterium]
ATAQWFIAMDQNRLRSRAVEAAGKVAYEPAWGQGRLVQMLENHPEWCISRQRTWGTPIPAVTCTACGESILDARVARTAAARFAEHGADIWWSDDVASYLPKGFACPKCAATTFEKEKNIVDIWFESGVSHLAVLGKNDIPWPGDLVLEGGDQYRGWFRSSIVTAVALKGEAPYRTVVKNGWVNDEQGRPMSKSKGTGIDADDAMNKWGADVLRLWSASVEFVDDVRFGPNVIDQVGRVYRNLRNRLRFMLGNIEALSVDALVARDAMTPLDRLACEIGDSFLSEVTANYHRYAIHDAYLRLVEFESSMSTLYFDALKDPLYSDARDGVRRRSAQSALLHLLKTFAVALAPVLSFTAEEAWQAIPAGLRDGAESVFDASFGTLPPANEATLSLWDVLRDLRARVAAGDPRDFEARIRVTAGEDMYDPLHALGDGLREALVVSDVHLERASGTGIIGFEQLRAEGEKCARCWKFRTLDSETQLCAPCAHIVGAG